MGPPFGSMGVWDQLSAGPVFETSCLGPLFGTMGVWDLPFGTMGVWDHRLGPCVFGTMFFWDHVCVGTHNLGPWTAVWDQLFGTMGVWDRDWDEAFGTTVWDHGCLGPAVWLPPFGTMAPFGTFGTMGRLMRVHCLVWDHGCLGPTLWDHGRLGPWVFGTMVWDRLVWAGGQAVPDGAWMAAARRHDNAAGMAGPVVCATKPSEEEEAVGMLDPSSQAGKIWHSREGKKGLAVSKASFCPRLPGLPKAFSEAECK